MGNGNGSGSFSSRKFAKPIADSSSSYVTNSAPPQRTSFDESLVDATNFVELERKLYKYRDEETDVSEDVRYSSRVASLKRDSQHEPISPDDQIRRSRQTRGNIAWNERLANGEHIPDNEDPEVFSRLSVASVRSNSYIPNNATKSQSNTKASYAQRDSEVLKDNSFSALSVSDSLNCHQDPFSDCATPVQLKVRTDLFRKSRQHQSRNKAHSLPSSPTGKKVRNVGRRGTVQSAVEPQTKRKTQAPPPLSTHIHHEGESSLNQMNRAAKISLVSNDSSIAKKEDLSLLPFSIPTYLELELSSNGPPAQYRLPSAAIVPFESYKVTLEKLLNFLIVPLKLELFIGFGTLACFDSWLYTFTILPLRFCKALWILFLWLKKNAGKEIADLGFSVFDAFRTIWFHNPSANGVWWESNAEKEKANNAAKYQIDYADRRTGDHRKTGDTQPSALSQRQAGSSRGFYKHRRTRSTPSALVANHKADLLRGLLFIFSCVFLTHLDASRMYHNIRGQSTIKLYVIYNVLEVSRSLQLHVKLWH